MELHCTYTASQRSNDNNCKFSRYSDQSRYIRNRVDNAGHHYSVIRGTIIIIPTRFLLDAVYFTYRQSNEAIFKKRSIRCGE